MIGKTQKTIPSFFLISFELEYFGHYFKGQFRLGDNMHYCTISKCEQIRWKSLICWHLLNIFLMVNFILLVQWLLIMTCFHLEFLQNISRYITNSSNLLDSANSKLAITCSNTIAKTLNHSPKCVQDLH